MTTSTTTAGTLVIVAARRTGAGSAEATVSSGPSWAVASPSGHPTGAVLVVKALYDLRGTGRRYALVTMCGELAIHRPRVFALSLVPRPRMTCSFSGVGKGPLRRAFVVLCAIRARPEDWISLTGLFPIWLPKRGVAGGRDRVLVWSDPM